MAFTDSETISTLGISFSTDTCARGKVVNSCSWRTTAGLAHVLQLAAPQVDVFHLSQGERVEGDGCWGHATTRARFSRGSQPARGWWQEPGVAWGLWVVGDGEDNDNMIVVSFK